MNKSSSKESSNIYCAHLLTVFLLRAGHGPASTSQTKSKNKKQAVKLLSDGRVNFALPADYRENKDIDKVVKTILDKIATERDLDELKAREEKKKIIKRTK